jgi:hypothetical protein
MKSNSSQLNENEVSIRSANAKTVPMNANNGYVGRRAKVSALLTQADLSELRELIGTIWLTGHSPSPEVDQIVASFNRVGSGFTARLAVRALRLEQALNAAQERIICLEWNLAQANKLGRSR